MLLHIGLGILCTPLLMLSLHAWLSGTTNAMMKRASRSGGDMQLMAAERQAVHFHVDKLFARSMTGNLCWAAQSFR